MYTVNSLPGERKIYQIERAEAGRSVFILFSFDKYRTVVSISLPKMTPHYTDKLKPNQHVLDNDITEDYIRATYPKYFA